MGTTPCPTCSRPLDECPKCGNEQYCHYCDRCRVCSSTPRTSSLYRGRRVYFITVDAGEIAADGYVEKRWVYGKHRSHAAAVQADAGRGLCSNTTIKRAVCGDNGLWKTL